MTDASRHLQSQAQEPPFRFRPVHATEGDPRRPASISACGRSKAEPLRLSCRCSGEDWSPRLGSTRRPRTLQGCGPATLLPQHLDCRLPPAARQVGQAGRCPCGPSLNQLGMARPAPSRPDQRGGSRGDVGVRAGGDHRLDSLTGDRLEHHTSRMGHHDAVKWRRCILRHGIPSTATLRGLSSPFRVLRGGLAALRAPAPLLRLGQAGGALDGGPAPAQLLKRPERHAPSLQRPVPPGPGHRAQLGDDGPGIRRPDHETIGDFKVRARDRLEGGAIDAYVFPGKEERAPQHPAICPHGRRVGRGRRPRPVSLRHPQPPPDQGCSHLQTDRQLAGRANPP